MSWGVLIDIADACAAHGDNQNDVAMRTAMFDEVKQAVGPNAENKELATRAIVSVRPWNWLAEQGGGRALFLDWFEHHLHAKALEWAVERLRYLELPLRLRLIEGVLGRLVPNDVNTHSFVNVVGRTLASLCFWLPADDPRQLWRRLRDAQPRPSALNDRRSWRSFVDGFAWSLANDLGHVDEAADQGLRNAAMGRYVGLATEAWRCWPRAEQDDRSAIAWALLSPLQRDYDGPKRAWSEELQELLLSVIKDADHIDIAAAFQTFMWANVDSNTLVHAAHALTDRAKRTTEAAQSIVLIDILEEVGVLRALPLIDAHKILDCLQAMGRTLPRATAAAARLERRIRLEES